MRSDVLIAALALSMAAPGYNVSTSWPASMGYAHPNKKKRSKAKRAARPAKAKAHNQRNKKGRP